MKPQRTINFQIGKSGVTQGVIDSLNLAFKNHKRIRISLLPSSGRNRETIKKMAEDLISKLEGNFQYSVIGFTIILKKRTLLKK